MPAKSSVATCGDVSPEACPVAMPKVVRTIAVEYEARKFRNIQQGGGSLESSMKSLFRYMDGGRFDLIAASD